jgi:hypothetical protein
MALAVAIDLGPRLATLRMLAAIRETLPQAVGLGVDSAVAALSADHEGLTPEDVSDIVDETLGRLLPEAEDHLRSQAVAVYEAFALTCREEMGLNAETVLRAVLGPLYYDALALDRLDGAKPGQEALAAWREMFGRKWAEQTRG